MLNVMFLLALLWFGFVWTTWTTRSSSGNSLQLRAPVSKRNCSEETVDCIDDCSFLCVEPNSKCVGGKCIPFVSSNKECNRDRGGILVLTRENGLEHWKCMCTHPSIWSGSDCSQLNPDVCENGVYLYNNGQGTCICSFPYSLLVLNGKPHCVDSAMLNFFQNVQAELETGPDIS